MVAFVVQSVGRAEMRSGCVRSVPLRGPRGGSCAATPNRRAVVATSVDALQGGRTPTQRAAVEAEIIRRTTRETPANVTQWSTAHCWTAP